MKIYIIIPTLMACVLFVSTSVIAANENYCQIDVRLFTEGVQAENSEKKFLEKNKEINSYENTGLSSSYGTTTLNSLEYFANLKKMDMELKLLELEKNNTANIWESSKSISNQAELKDITRINNLYKQYCADKEVWRSFVLPQKYYDTYDENFNHRLFFTTKDLVCQLEKKESSGFTVGINMFHIAKSLAIQGKNKEAFNFYKCAADRYLDPSSANKMSQVYRHGSKQLLLINNIKKDDIKILPNPKIAYAYLLNTFYAGFEYESIMIRPESQVGYDAIARLDYLQSNLTKLDLVQIERKQKTYLSRFFSSARDSKLSLYAHSMYAVKDALRIK